MKNWIIFGIIILLIFGIIIYIYSANRLNNPKLDCESKGGDWGKFAYMNPDSPESCNLPTKDSGNICDDSKQCESFCQAKMGAAVGSKEAGTCYGWRAYPPCYTQIVNGSVRPEVCA